MKISVIIATKNRFEYLLDLLSDLQFQNRKVDEVVISDQSDSFNKVENQYSFNLIHFKHDGIGPCCSRNDAADKSSNEILIFLDDDARIERHFIEEIIKPILENKTSVCSGAVCKLDGTFINKKETNNHWFYKLTVVPKKEVEECFYTPAGCTAILRKTFYKVGKFDQYFDPNGAAEDREFAVRLVRNGFKIFFNPKAKLLHIGAPKGGRRSDKNTTLVFQKNIGFIIYKYYGLKKLQEYRLYLVKQRLKQVFKLKLPMHNVEMLYKLIKMTNRKAYDEYLHKRN
jgi:GT2 family glycosyltransferase